MSPRGDGSDGEGFLTRWARRKAEVAREDSPTANLRTEGPLPPALGGEGLGVGGRKAEAPSSIVEPGGATPRSDPPHRKRGDGEEPEAELVEPPSLDLVDKDFDVAHWLKQNVPESWKLAALRRAWESDPAIRDFENPARDYALDWNTPGGAPGYGPLTESDDVEAMVRGIFGETPPTDIEPPMVAEATGDSMSQRLSSYDAEPRSDIAAQENGSPEPQAPPDETDCSGEESGATCQIAQNPAGRALAAVQHSVEPEAAPRRVRRRGGGAVPN